MRLLSPSSVSEASLYLPTCLQTMDQRVGLFILLAAGLLCLSLVPICQADDQLEDAIGDDVDVEDELDLGLAGADEEEEDGDVQDEAPPAPKSPPTPKVFINQLSRIDNGRTGFIKALLDP